MNVTNNNCTVNRGRIRCNEWLHYIVINVTSNKIDVKYWIDEMIRGKYVVNGCFCSMCTYPSRTVSWIYLFHLESPSVIDRSTCPRGIPFPGHSRFQFAGSLPPCLFPCGFCRSVPRVLYLMVFYLYHIDVFQIFLEVHYYYAQCTKDRTSYIEPRRSRT